jgi:DNA-binding MltR family transcriptional regulator
MSDQPLKIDAEIQAQIKAQSRELVLMLVDQQESDRGCVIFGAAMLEEELESLLRACCRTDPSTVKAVIDPLFRGYAPLSTFAAKIQVSYALGFISKDLYKALDLVRKLRNDCAHEKAAVSFQSAKYEMRLRAIVACHAESSPRAWRSFEMDEKLAQMRKTAKREFVDRLSFCFCMSGMVGQIQVAKAIMSGRIKLGRTKSAP